MGLEFCGMESIQERVEALRREIAEIQKLNQACPQSRRKSAASYEHYGRQERLQQIMDELKSMTSGRNPDDG
jgi:hypothetical protein